MADRLHNYGRGWSTQWWHYQGFTFNPGDGIDPPRGMMRTSLAFDDPAVRTEHAIDKLKGLQQPGWDSHDADPIQVAALEQAKGFIRLVERKVGPEYASPVVGPTADGGVALIWRKPGHTKVEAFFSPEGSRYVVIRDRKLIARGPVKDSDFVRQFVKL